MINWYFIYVYFKNALLFHLIICPFYITAERYSGNQPNHAIVTFSVLIIFFTCWSFTLISFLTNDGHSVHNICISYLTTHIFALLLRLQTELPSIWDVSTKQTLFMLNKKHNKQRKILLTFIWGLFSNGIPCTLHNKIKRYMPFVL